ncbi:MAG: hypothetical protein JWP87_4142 [Labilithrix sp.]|nr:hypothetical protein [Labilithrix sp.]
MLDRHLFTPILGTALALALLASACTKIEGQSSGTSTTGTAATATPSGSTTAAAAAPDASPTGADTTTGTTPTGGADATAPTASGASGTGSATAKNAGVASAAAAASAGPVECGTKPLPDCPLQAWMKANTNPAVAASDFPALATALDKIAAFTPAGYTNWASIAKDGAKAARAQDMTAAKASCRTCHDQYKDKYKKEMRARKI